MESGLIVLPWRLMFAPGSGFGSTARFHGQYLHLLSPTLLLRALTERCSRFCTAPTLPRAWVTDAIAVSIVSSAVKASAEAVTEREAIPKVDDVTASRPRVLFRSSLLFDVLSIPI